MSLRILPRLLLVSTAGALMSCTVIPIGNVDEKTNAVIQAMNDKLAAAKTVRVQATRTASPGFNGGVPVAETTRGTVVVQRPYRLAAHTQSSLGRRDAGFDGRSVTVVDRSAKTHATVSGLGSIDHVLGYVRDAYGVAVPVGELLANHPRAVLLGGVTSGKHVGVENVNGVECDHMRFEQERMSWQLWVGTKDHLPRRISVAFDGGEDGRRRTMESVITRWELDVPVSETELTVAPPAGSRAVAMVPVR